MINGNTNGIYLDDECYEPFWERVVELNVPVYIHPAPPHPAVGPERLYRAARHGMRVDHRQLLALPAPALQWPVRPLPRANNHLGATWARRSRTSCGDRQSLRGVARPGRPPKKKPSTTSTRPHHHDYRPVPGSSLQCAITEMGDDRVLFSVTILSRARRRPPTGSKTAC